MIIKALRKLKYQAHRKWQESLHLRPFLFSRGLTRYSHGLNPYATQFVDMPARSQQSILDLSSGITLLERPNQSIQLVAYPRYTNYAELSPVEVWTLVGGESLSQCPDFRLDQQRQILQQIDKRLPAYSIKEPMLILRHYNTHFGHFCGEVLGQLIWCANLIRTSNDLRSIKLAVFAPSPSWQDFLCEIFPDVSFRFYDPSILHEYVLELDNAWIAPHLSIWQSLAIARNTIFRYLFSCSEARPCSASDRNPLFLTSAPPLSRISNFDEVNSLLSARGFSLIRPMDLSVSELLNKLALASHVVSEQGSIFFNVMLSRTGTTLVLSSKVAYGVDMARAMSCGSIYNESARGIYEELLCEPVNYDHHLHPYSQVIHVPVLELAQALGKFA